MFKTGDVVQLKSGSPAMTVRKAFGDMVEVDWFDDKAKCFTRAFQIESLKFVEDVDDTEDFTDEAV